MTLYYIAYYSGSYNVSGPFADLSSAQSAYNWFTSLQEISYVVLLSTSATNVQSSGSATA